MATAEEATGRYLIATLTAFSRVISVQWFGVDRKSAMAVWAPIDFGIDSHLLVLVQPTTTTAGSLLVLARDRVRVLERDASADSAHDAMLDFVVRELEWEQDVEKRLHSGSDGSCGWAMPGRAQEEGKALVGLRVCVEGMGVS